MLPCYFRRFSVVLCDISNVRVFVFHIRASRIAGQCTSAHLPRVMLLSLFCEHGRICSFAYITIRSST